MKGREQLHVMGQSLWLDNVTRGLLTSGTLERCNRELSVAGLTSNPNIFDHAIRDTGFYDEGFSGKIQQAAENIEKLLFELAVEDLAKGADVSRQIHDATNGVYGWVFGSPAVALTPVSWPFSFKERALRRSSSPGRT
jgi:transaldolase